MNLKAFKETCQYRTNSDSTDHEASDLKFKYASYCKADSISKCGDLPTTQIGNWKCGHAQCNLECPAGQLQKTSLSIECHCVSLELKKWFIIVKIFKQYFRMKNVNFEKLAQNGCQISEEKYLIWVLRAKTDSNVKVSQQRSSLPLFSPENASYWNFRTSPRELGCVQTGINIAYFRVIVIWRNGSPIFPC